MFRLTSPIAMHGYQDDISRLAMERDRYRIALESIAKGGPWCRDGKYIGIHTIVHKALNP